ncbi:MAG: Gfo/Idh/MocA family protein [Micrococcaceae bacterium]
MTADPSRPLRLAIFGAGMIGREHVKYARAENRVELVALADPAEAAAELARENGITWYADYHELLASEDLDAVIIALPNVLHAPAAIAVMEAGCAVLLEKPIADTVEAALEIVAAQRHTGAPLLVGHQRRHAPDLVAAKRLIDDGGLGEIVSVSLMSTWRKNDAYFEVPWRVAPGAGPILINLIHDLDALRYLVGDVTDVVALGSNAQRGHAVADTAGAVLRFEQGALGTVMLSDAAVSPWNWDLTSGYGAYFPAPPEEDVYFLSGTKAALSLPSLTLYSYETDKEGVEQEGHWQVPLTRRTVERVERNAYVQQLDHFIAVVRGEQNPVVSAEDAYRSLVTTVAVDEAQASGARVDVRP